MSPPLNVVALSGGTSRPSRTRALTEASLAELAEHLHIKPHLI
ncbi:FMN reductase, partial [Pseudomonas sp. SIMBA_068]